MTQQALDLGLVDEVCVSLVPVLFGEGIPYFSMLEGGTCCSTTRSSSRADVPSTSGTRSDVRPRCSDAAVDRPPDIITTATDYPAGCRTVGLAGLG